VWLTAKGKNGGKGERRKKLTKIMLKGGLSIRKGSGKNKKNGKKTKRGGRR